MLRKSFVSKTITENYTFNKGLPFNFIYLFIFSTGFFSKAFSAVPNGTLIPVNVLVILDIGLNFNCYHSKSVDLL